MTPKEKAQEIFDKMDNISLTTASAQQCALVAVDEILTSKQTAYPNQVIELGQVFYSYWQEVKTELENL